MECFCVCSAFEVFSPLSRSKREWWVWAQFGFGLERPVLVLAPQCSLAFSGDSPSCSLVQGCGLHVVVEREVRRKGWVSAGEALA